MARQADVYGLCVQVLEGAGLQVPLGLGSLVRPFYSRNTLPLMDKGKYGFSGLKQPLTA